MRMTTSRRSKSIEVNGFAGEVLTGGSTLQGSGTINDSGVGNIRIDDGTTLSIAKGGTFDLQTDAGIQQGYGAGGLVLSAGMLEKTVGTNVSTISTPLNNTGSVAVTTGVLDITGAVEQVTGTTLEAGIWSVTSTATVQSTLEFASPASLSAIGLGATVTLEAAFTRSLSSAERRRMRAVRACSSAGLHDRRVVQQLRHRPPWNA